MRGFKMGKNTKPMLTVLVEGDKLQQFRDYALSKEVSMGWVVNRLLDRLLSGELDVMGDTPSIGATRENIESISTGLTREDVESIVKSSIDNQLVDSNRDYIEELVKSCIDNLGTNDIEGITRVSIEVAIEPIKESVSELKTQMSVVVERLDAIESGALVPKGLVMEPELPKISPKSCRDVNEAGISTPDFDEHIRPILKPFPSRGYYFRFDDLAQPELKAVTQAQAKLLGFKSEPIKVAGESIRVWLGREYCF